MPRIVFSLLIFQLMSPRNLLMCTRFLVLAMSTRCYRYLTFLFLTAFYFFIFVLVTRLQGCVWKQLLIETNPSFNKLKLLPNKSFNFLFFFYALCKLNFYFLKKKANKLRKMIRTPPMNPTSTLRKQIFGITIIINLNIQFLFIKFMWV